MYIKYVGETHTVEDIEITERQPPLLRDTSEGDISECTIMKTKSMPHQEKSAEVEQVYSDTLEKGHLLYDVGMSLRSKH